MHPIPRRAPHALSALLALALLGPAGWGPLGVLPGLRLAGSAEPEAVRDWSFTDAHPLIAVETRGPLFRHSVTVLCVQAGGELYLMARHAPRAGGRAAGMDVYRLDDPPPGG